MTVTDANAGGLLATLESLPAFLPYSRMDKSKDDVWLSPEVCFLCISAQPCMSLWSLFEASEWSTGALCERCPASR